MVDGLKAIRDDLCDPRSKSGRQLLMVIVSQVKLSEKALSAQIDLAPGLVDWVASEGPDDFAFELSVPIQLKRRGGELKLILQGAGNDPSIPDPNLIKTILDARLRFAAYTRQDNPKSISQIAIAAGASPADISRSMHRPFSRRI